MIGTTAFGGSRWREAVVLVHSKLAVRHFCAEWLAAHRKVGGNISYRNIRREIVCDFLTSAAGVRTKISSRSGPTVS